MNHIRTLSDRAASLTVRFSDIAVRNFGNTVMDHRLSRRSFIRSAASTTAAGAALIAIGGCTNKVRYHGYVVSREALSQVPVGSSQEQVLLALGTPSTTSTIGGETYFYISSRVEEKAFFAPKTTERRVLAVHFDENQQVERIADYGLQDGRVFDFVSRTTATGGAQVNLIRQLLGNVGQGTGGL